MRTTRVIRALVSAILLTFFLFPAAAHAANVTVGCGGVSGTYDFPTINAALAVIGQTGPSTITVTGTCQENVSFVNARAIIIVAGSSGAAIVGPLDTNAFDINLSQDITLVNLDISGTFSTTGNGGGGGVVITQASDVHIVGCNIHDNQSVGVDADTGSIVFLRRTTIQNNNPNDGLDLFDNSTARVINSKILNNGDSLNGGVGVFASRNSVVVFGGQANLVQNNANVGIQARNLSNVVLGGGGTTIEGHLIKGIILEEGSHLQVNSPGALIQGNGTACPLDPTCGGVFATQNSTVDLTTGTISGNHGSGVSVQQGTNVQLNNAAVSNNTGDGVHIKWISIGSFGSGNTITGNGGASIFCSGRSLALGNLSTFSNVRCGDN